MDNIRSMARNLPQQGRNEKENSLREHFKTAALAVTNLYKTASENLSSEARKAGYDEALDDLLALLLEDNISLEGVRQWCLLQKTANPDESEEEAIETACVAPASATVAPANNPVTNTGIFTIPTFPPPTSHTSHRDRRRGKRRLAMGDVFDLDASPKRRRRPHP